MTENATAKTIEALFVDIQKNLPTDWLDLTEDLKLHHLLKAVNSVLQPKGNWILVDGDRTLLDLISPPS